MKSLKSTIILITLSLLIMSFTTFNPFEKELLDIKITNIKMNSGNVVVEIYNDKSDWLKNPYQKVILSSVQSIQTATFKVPYGKYAITVYQDLNKNGEADMNFLGIPKELVGFGNNYKPFGEPKFKSSLIEFSKNTKTFEVKLYKVI